MDLWQLREISFGLQPPLARGLHWLPWPEEAFQGFSGTTRQKVETPEGCGKEMNP
jgi:hypothetical protein